MIARLLGRPDDRRRGPQRVLRVGGAVVSHRHANFVLNVGGASASDVRRLIDLVVERVAARCGVLLEPELAYVGAGFSQARHDGPVAAPTAR